MKRKMSGGIEVLGQMDLVNSDLLPTQIGRHYSRFNGQEKAILESWGFQFSKPSADDPIFGRAKLPDGWKLVATNHPMLSTLVDEFDRTRVEVFYEVAYYDRIAYMRITNRIAWQHDYEIGDRCVIRVIADRKASGGETTLFEISEPLPYPRKVDITREQFRLNYGFLKVIKNHIRNWLGENYPDYQNPCAYWDCELFSHPNEGRRYGT
jgi:hypothetical protein